jgi:hypothetical protein
MRCKENRFVLLQTTQQVVRPDSLIHLVPTR